MPEPVAQRLKAGEAVIADGYADDTILFADIVDFTQLAARIKPQELVDLLNQIFSAFDRLTRRYGLEKIKTIGDAYMVVGGMPVARADHAAAIAKMALQMHAEAARVGQELGEPLRLRIGIDSGPVIAGVIGQQKFAYDLWGDSVNMASRMESHGVANHTQMTESAYQRLRGNYLCEKRGTISVKGKAEMTTYFLTGKRKEV
jgi:class 3 adenylate cyclase